MAGIALITGASSGLGQEIVRQLHREKYGEIWAVARRRERLLALQELTEIPVRAIPLDLTDESAIGELEALLGEEKPRISLLVNAAGFGKIGNYAEVPRRDSDRMIDLNCRAAVDLCTLAIPYMGRGSHIMNICSTAGFQPFPQLNVYAASKAFLYRYSRALRFDDSSKGLWLGALGARPGERLLEVGCGSGIFCHRVKSYLPDVSVTGIDLDDSHIAFAREKSDRLGLDCRFVVGDATALPFGDASFDLCFSHTVAEHIPHDAFFGEQRRVLRPGGRIVVFSVRTRLNIRSDDAMGDEEAAKAFTGDTPEVLANDQYQDPHIHLNK